MEFGFREILLVLIIILLFFGAKRVPELMKAMGQGVKEFKKAAKDISSDDETTTTAPKTPSPSTKNDSEKNA
jgi:sec-independent protein translocase protein TatA